MGYLDRNDVQHNMPMDELPYNGGYPLWKPPYFPRGEAPPPYEEAVAAARAEQAALLSSMNPHAMAPLNFRTYLTPQHAHPNVSIVVNSQNGLPASTPSLSTNNPNLSPSISTNNRPLSSPSVHSTYYQLNQNEMNSSYCPGNCSSYAVTSNMYENLPNPSNRVGFSPSASSITSQHSHKSNQALAQNSHTTCNDNFQQHAIIPHQSGAFNISSTLPNPNLGNHRTIPKAIASSGSLRLQRDSSAHESVTPLLNTPMLNTKDATTDKILLPNQ